MAHARAHAAGLRIDPYVRPVPPRAADADDDDLSPDAARVRQRQRQLFQDTLVHFGQQAGTWSRPRAQALHFIVCVDAGEAGREDGCRLVTCSQGDADWRLLPDVRDGAGGGLPRSRSRIVAIAYSTVRRRLVALDEDPASRCVCLVTVDPRRGTSHTVAALVSRGRTLRHVRALCYGPENLGAVAARLRQYNDGVLGLHHGGGGSGNSGGGGRRSPRRFQAYRQLYCILRHNRGLALRSDAICRVEEKTGIVRPVLLTGRDDVVAIAAPPDFNGPWGDAVLYFWSVSSGLHSVHWGADGGGEIRAVNATLTPEGFRHGGGGLRTVRSLMFSASGTLFAATGRGIAVVSLADGTMSSVERLPPCPYGPVTRCCWVPEAVVPAPPSPSADAPGADHQTESKSSPTAMTELQRTQLRRVGDLDNAYARVAAERGGGGGGGGVSILAATPNLTSAPGPSSSSSSIAFPSFVLPTDRPAALDAIGQEGGGEVLREATENFDGALALERERAMQAAEEQRETLRIEKLAAAADRQLLEQARARRKAEELALEAEKAELQETQGLLQRAAMKKRGGGGAAPGSKEEEAEAESTFRARLARERERANRNMQDRLLRENIELVESWERAHAAVAREKEALAREKAGLEAERRRAREDQEEQAAAAERRRMLEQAAQDQKAALSAKKRLDLSEEAMRGAMARFRIEEEEIEKALAAQFSQQRTGHGHGHATGEVSESVDYAAAAAAPPPPSGTDSKTSGDATVATRTSTTTTSNTINNHDNRNTTEIYHITHNNNHKAAASPGASPPSPPPPPPKNTQMTLGSAVLEAERHELRILLERLGGGQDGDSGTVAAGLEQRLREMVEKAARELDAAAHRRAAADTGDPQTPTDAAAEWIIAQQQRMLEQQMQSGSNALAEELARTRELRAELERALADVRRQAQTMSPPSPPPPPPPDYLYGTPPPPPPPMQPASLFLSPADMAWQQRQHQAQMLAAQQLVEEEARIARRRASVAQRQARHDKDYEAFMRLQREEEEAVAERRRKRQVQEELDEREQEFARRMRLQKAAEEAQEREEEAAREAARRRRQQREEEEEDGERQLRRQADAEYQRALSSAARAPLPSAGKMISPGQQLKLERQRQHEAALREAARVRRDELEAHRARRMAAQRLDGSQVAGLMTVGDDNPVEQMLAQQVRVLLLSVLDCQATNLWLRVSVHSQTFLPNPHWVLIPFVFGHPGTGLDDVHRLLSRLQPRPQTWARHGVGRRGRWRSRWIRCVVLAGTVSGTAARIGQPAASI